MRFSRLSIRRQEEMYGREYFPAECSGGDVLHFQQHDYDESSLGEDRSPRDVDPRTSKLTFPEPDWWGIDRGVQSAGKQQRHQQIV